MQYQIDEIWKLLIKSNQGLTYMCYLYSIIIKDQPI